MKYEYLNNQLTGPAFITADGTLSQPLRINIGVVGDTYGKANWWDDFVITEIPVSATWGDVATFIATACQNYITSTYPNT